MSIDVESRPETTTEPQTATAAVSDQSTASAQRLADVMGHILGTHQWQLRLWNGATAGPADGARFVLSVHSRSGLDRLLNAAPDRGFGRAYVEGHIDVEPLEAFFEVVHSIPRRRLIAGLPALLRVAISLGARPALQSLAAEARLHGRRHSRQRDSAAVRFHYDLAPEFYALWLDRTMTYSCAYFEHPDDELDTAQAAKLDLVCRKLRLQPGERLLDIGCGWGSMVVHAAEHYGVHATGITLSPKQAEITRRRAAERAVADRVSVRVADYRDDLGGPFDAIASIGMFEHVGRTRMSEYAMCLRNALRPGGRVLNHGITTWPGDPGHDPIGDSFVFPDAQLQEIGSVITHLQAAGLEVRDVESLREHYALTLEHWVRRLDARQPEAVALVGRERVRAWRFFLTASVVGFRVNATSVHQVLAVRADAAGGSGMPLTRAAWYQDGTAAHFEGDGHRT